MIQRTYARMNRPEEGPEALDTRKYCSCNYHGKSGNKKRKFGYTITALNDNV